MARFRIGLHLLETLTSALYDDPIILFREYVQNSIDAYNAAVNKDSSLLLENFCVDINIDTECRNITIIDNGYGISSEHFLEKMLDISASDKINSNDQIGFRGIGRLSAMPFCERLLFSCKNQGSDEIIRFEWNGQKFHELLHKEDKLELEDAVSIISGMKAPLHDKNVNAHCFQVDILGYNDEINELISQKDFNNRLRMMLPLRYCPGFKYQKQISDRYFEYMNERIEKFSVAVKLNGENLYKPYSDSNILDSDICFWDLKYRSKHKGIPGEKIGIIWYTFNHRMTANPADEPFGILVRSKNMLMGDHNSLAQALFRGKSDDYVATFRELAQTLQGVYGEMLLNSPRLKDNARRDWFKLDDDSIELRHIIFDFMKRLHKYRYVSSRAFNAIELNMNKQKLEKAYVELTSNYEPKDYVDSFYESKKKADAEKTKPAFKFADEDIPLQTVTIKKFYEKFLLLAQDFFDKESLPQIFMKMRAFIKKRMG